MLNRRTIGARRQRGLSIVELMVGVTIGLLVVAASALLVSGQLTENRRLMLEIQVQQDLRASADIIVRDLRRSGIWNDAQTVGVWWSGNTNPSCNAYSALHLPGDGITYYYYRDADRNTPLGIKLENGVLKTAIQGPGIVASSICEQTDGPTNWQELTDSRSLKITRFDISMAANGSVERLPCPKLCADGSTDCWPELQVRAVHLVLEGEAANDPSVKRSIETTVKLRNDAVVYDPDHPTQMCPT